MKSYDRRLISNYRMRKLISNISCISPEDRRWRKTCTHKRKNRNAHEKNEILGQSYNMIYYMAKSYSAPLRQSPTRRSCFRSIFSKSKLVKNCSLRRRQIDDKRQWNSHIHINDNKLSTSGTRICRFLSAAETASGTKMVKTRKQGSTDGALYSF